MSSWWALVLSEVLSPAAVWAPVLHVGSCPVCGLLTHTWAPARRARGLKGAAVKAVARRAGPWWFQLSWPLQRRAAVRAPP